MVPPLDFRLLDLAFQTYVLQAPTSKQQCKKGGWRQFEVVIIRTRASA